MRFIIAGSGLTFSPCFSVSLSYTNKFLSGISDVYHVASCISALHKQRYILIKWFIQRKFDVLSKSATNKLCNVNEIQM